MNKPCPACQYAPSVITSGAIGDDFILLLCPNCHAEWRVCDENPDGARIYWYVNRWFDEAETVHHFGLQATESTLRDANRGVGFNIIAVAVDLVYGPATYAEMLEFLVDVGPGGLDGGIDTYTIQPQD